MNKSTLQPRWGLRSGHSLSCLGCEAQPEHGHPRASQSPRRHSWAIDVLGWGGFGEDRDKQKFAQGPAQPISPLCKRPGQPGRTGSVAAPTRGVPRGGGGLLRTDKAEEEDDLQLD